MDKQIEKSKTVEIVLDFPVQLPDRLLEKVTVRRPILKDLIKHNIDANSSVMATANFAADLCNLLPDEIELLDVADYEKIADAVGRFRNAV